jgi:ABC-type phosphate transport system substrate-binding protein
MMKVLRQVGTLVRTIFVSGVILVFAATAFGADYKVVTNKSATVTSLSKGDLQAIFLGEKSKWDDGKTIKIVVLEDGDTNKAFLQGVVGKTPSQFESYWKKLIFTGKAAAPKSFGESAAIVDFVAGHPGSIGYVSSGQAVGSVKTISVK